MQINYINVVSNYAMEFLWIAWFFFRIAWINNEDKKGERSSKEISENDFVLRWLKFKLNLILKSYYDIVVSQETKTQSSNERVRESEREREGWKGTSKKQKINKFVMYT